MRTARMVENGDAPTMPKPLAGAAASPATTVPWPEAGSLSAIWLKAASVFRARFVEQSTLPGSRVPSSANSSCPAAMPESTTAMVGNATSA